MQLTTPTASWDDRPLSRTLSESECWAYLAQAPYGRIATRAADEMDVFPVNHGLDQGCVVFRTSAGTKLIELTIHNSIVFQIDGYDENEAFSVVVKGDADEVTSAGRIAVLDDLKMYRWTPEEKDRWVAITPTKVTGRVFTLAKQI